MRRIHKLLTMMSGGGAAAPVLLISDTFTGVDGTNLTAHTPDTNTPGGAWTKYSAANILLASNLANAAGTAMYGIQSGKADVRLISKVKLNGNGTSGVALRITNNSNYWLCGVGNSGGKIAVNLYEANAGVFTIRGQSISAINYSSGATHTLTINASGTAISVALTGHATPVTYTSTFNQAATIHGVRAADANDGFDDWQCFF